MTKGPSDNPAARMAVVQLSREVEVEDTVQRSYAKSSARGVRDYAQKSGLIHNHNPACGRKSAAGAARAAASRTILQGFS
jgi:hypothetical protein